MSGEAIPSLADIEARVALDDHTGAVELARLRLRAVPDDTGARQLLERCEQVLVRMYVGRIGDLRQRLHVTKSDVELRWLSLDHRAGFLVSRVLEAPSVEELLEVCGMGRLDALRILHELVQQKVIELREPA